MASPNGISLKNPYIRDNLNRANKLLGVYTGYTRDTKDEAQLRGRIAVFIPVFFDSSDQSDVSANWFNCEWSSPFWGQTFRGIRGKDEKNYTNSQSTYGMWMVPPDPGTEVLVSFKDGNLKTPVIVGCPVNNQYNYTVPGFPGGVSYGDPAVNAPVAEKNLNADPGKHKATTARPLHVDIAEGITRQGLINDPIRGAGSSGARRESPSKVFGIMTPGDWDASNPNLEPGSQEAVRNAGHQFIMDDKNGSRMIRLRSGRGNQILLADDINTIYCINSRGEVWWEMDGSGNFNLYAKRGIHVRTQGDFNLRADGTINMEAGGDFNIKAAGDQRAGQYVGGAVQEVASGFGLPTLGTGGRVNINGKQSLQLYGDRNVRLTAGGGDIDINSGGATNIQASGANPLNGAAINLTSLGPGMIVAHATSVIQLQSTALVNLTAPLINAGGGLINLNTSPPTPVAPGIALPSPRLAGKPLPDVDSEPPEFKREAAREGASAFPTQGKRDSNLTLDIYTICTKLMTPEPYAGHGQYDPIEKASDTEFNESLAEFLPPGSSGNGDSTAPADVVKNNPQTGNSTVDKGLAYVDEAGKELKSASDQVKDAYNQAEGEFQAEVDQIKGDLKEQFPEYEQYADVFNNVTSLFDSDLSAIQRIDIALDMLGAIIPPMRFPTSNQLEEEIVGLDSKLTELESQLSQYGIDADALMADLLTGNIAGLKDQALGIMGDALADNLNTAEIKQKFADEGLDIAGLDPTDPMFPSVAITDKDGNTFVDFSNGLSDPAATLLGAGKLNTQFNELKGELPNLPLGETQQNGLTSFVDGIGGPEKFLSSNVGTEMKRASDAFGLGTPEGTEVGNAIMANVPRLMSGWVLASEKPGGPLVYNEDLFQRRQAEIALLTATDDMNLRAVFDDVKPASLTYGDINAKFRAQKELYFENKIPTGTDNEFGKLVKETNPST